MLVCVCVHACVLDVPVATEVDYDIHTLCSACAGHTELEHGAQGQEL